MGDQGDSEGCTLTSAVSSGGIHPDKAAELARDIWQETERIRKENEGENDNP